MTVLKKNKKKYCHVPSGFRIARAFRSLYQPNLHMFQPPTFSMLEYNLQFILDLHVGQEMTWYSAVHFILLSSRKRGATWHEIFQARSMARFSRRSVNEKPVYVRGTWETFISHLYPHDSPSGPSALLSGWLLLPRQRNVIHLLHDNHIHVES